MTTGEMPPGGRKDGAFIHDPKVVRIAGCMFSQKPNLDMKYEYFLGSNYVADLRKILIC